jgi:hypothetical protein
LLLPLLQCGFTDGLLAHLRRGKAPILAVQSALLPFILGINLT